MVVYPLCSNFSLCILVHEAVFFPFPCSTWYLNQMGREWKNEENVKQRRVGELKLSAKNGQSPT